MTGALDGIKVLEFTQIIAGPFGGMMLSDMGADVVKIEPIQGEAWRLNRQFIPGESKAYMSLNRGKRSLPLDLTNTKATAIVHRLVTDADVVVINARPDVSAKLKIDYATLSAINPRLIYCDNTAFGRKGPDSYRPGYDIIVQAVSGLMASEGKITDGVPGQITSVAVADFVSGIAIAWGVCAALYIREKTGKGQQVNTTLLGSALGVQTSSFMEVAALDGEPRHDFLAALEGMREAGASYEEIDAIHNNAFSAFRRGNVYYRTYQAKDGVLAVACLSDRLRKRVADILEIDDPRFKPGYDALSDEAAASSERLVKVAEKLFRERTVEDWLETFDRAGVPAGPVKFVQELLDDEQVAANDLVVELDHSLAGKVRMVGPIIDMSDTPLSVQGPSPALGEHTDEILESIGLDQDAIRELKDEGVTR